MTREEQNRLMVLLKPKFYCVPQEIRTLSYGGLIENYEENEENQRTCRTKTQKKTRYTNRVRSRKSHS
jgi:hypothetical protein